MAHTFEEIRAIVGDAMPGWDVVDGEDDPETYQFARVAPDAEQMRRNLHIAHDEPQVVVIRQETPHGIETRTVTLQHGRITQIQTHPAAFFQDARPHVWEYQERREAVAAEGGTDTRDEEPSRVVKKSKNHAEPVVTEERPLDVDATKVVTEEVVTGKQRGYRKYKNTVVPEAASPAVRM